MKFILYFIILFWSFIAFANVSYAADTYTASDYYSGNPPSNLAPFVAGGWAANGTGTGHWVAVDFGTMRQLTSIHMVQNASSGVSTVSLETYNGSTWVYAQGYSGLTANATLTLTTPVNCSAFRITNYSIAWNNVYWNLDEVTYQSNLPVATTTTSPGATTTTTSTTTTIPPGATVCYFNNYSSKLQNINSLVISIDSKMSIVEHLVMTPEIIQQSMSFFLGALTAVAFVFASKVT